MNKIFLILLILLFSCDVTFNPDLKEYIDNVADRTPLNFSVEGSSEIDEKTALNLGYRVTDYTFEIKITNNESSDIKLNATEALSGDFVIPALEAQTIKKGESLTLSGIYVPGNSLNKTVNATYALEDDKGRDFRLSLWGSSKSQPLDIIYNEEIIKAFDFGVFTGEDRTFSVINNGLSKVSVLSINTPGGVILNSEATMSLDIGESGEFIIVYSDINNPIEKEALTITTDSPIDNSLELDIYGGVNLGVTLVTLPDESDSGATLDFGLLTSGDKASGKKIELRLTNTTSFKINLTKSLSESSDITLITDLLDQEVGIGESVDFVINCYPGDLAATIDSEFRLEDQITGRYKTLYLTGSFTP